MRKGVTIIGYSGHAYVVVDSMNGMDIPIKGYCDKEKKSHNPFHLTYFGDEQSKEAEKKLAESFFFVAIGENKIREKVFQRLNQNQNFKSIYHCSSKAYISKNAHIGIGTFVSANCAINAFSEIGVGVICNTGCIIEHECQISDFAHIAPGAVLAGNVHIGERTFIGANSVVKQGVTIGEDVIIGAGTVILKDVPDRSTVVGNPGRIIASNA